MSPESLLSKDFCCALITDVKLLSLQHLHFLFPSHSAHSTHTLTAGLRKKKHYGNLFICCKYIYIYNTQACVIVREIVAWIFVGVISTRSFIIRAKTPFCSSFSFTAAVSLESRWNSFWLHQRRIYPQFWPSAHSFMSNTVPKVSSVRL